MLLKGCDKKNRRKCRGIYRVDWSGSISQSHGSADPDPNPHQNVMDPEHWLAGASTYHSKFACNFKILSVQISKRCFHLMPYTFREDPTISSVSYPDSIRSMDPDLDSESGSRKAEMNH